MNNSPVVRSLLWILGGVTLLLLYRAFSGPPGRSGLLVIEDIAAESLEHRSLDVDRQIRVTITGMGSFEDEDLEPPILAAYGWILDRKTRDVVWAMDAEHAIHGGRGLTAEVNDTLSLDEGQYEVFFTSYGNRWGDSSRRSFLGRIIGRLDWRNDSRLWHLVIDILDGKQTDARVVHRDEGEARRAPGEVVLWSSGPVRSRDFKQHLFEVKRDTRVRIRSTGEITSDVNDHGKLENLLASETVWTFDRAHSMPAGGLEQNRRAVTELNLPPGIYRASYQTDATHAYGDWRGNPPYDPYNWGLSLSFGSSADAVGDFDPWSGRTPVIAMMPTGNGEFRATTFSIERPERVMVYAQGEVKRNDRYDFAWIERAPTMQHENESDLGDRRPNPDATIWEMTYDESEPAGGGQSNRRAIAFLELDPDTYTLYYRTDDSHAYEDWRNGEPSESERWGAALFSMDQQAGAFHILNQFAFDYEHEREARRSERILREESVVETAPERASLSLPVDQDLILVALNRLGNNVSPKASFVLDEDTSLRIIGAGEITLSGNRYDYGSIERASDGQVIWEMTWDNTHPGGGDDSNRFFDGVVDFAAGEYVVRFKTDGTHAYGHFDSGAPGLPDAWGITVARLH